MERLGAERHRRASLVPPGDDCWLNAGHRPPPPGVGGNCYDFAALAEGRLGTAVGDVSGKGIFGGAADGQSLRFAAWIRGVACQPVRHVRLRKARGCKPTIERIRAADAFTAGAPQHHDMTLAVKLAGCRSGMTPAAIAM